MGVIVFLSERIMSRLFYAVFYCSFFFSFFNNCASAELGCTTNLSGLEAFDGADEILITDSSNMMSCIKDNLVVTGIVFGLIATVTYIYYRHIKNFKLVETQPHIQIQEQTTTIPVQSNQKLSSTHSELNMASGQYQQSSNSRQVPSFSVSSGNTRESTIRTVRSQPCLRMFQSSNGHSTDGHVSSSSLGSPTSSMNSFQELKEILHPKFVFNPTPIKPS